MQPEKIRQLAGALDRAMLEALERERLSVQESFPLDDAYLIQDEGIKLREARGERLVGFKMGLTSKAKREQMGLHQPIYGVLTDRMKVACGGSFSLKTSIHPKIEPEVAFITRSALSGRVTLEQARDACSGVCAALEILDSRFLNFKYFSLEDVVADNCSSAYFILGEQVLDPARIDVSDLDLSLEIDGRVAQSASSREISGHPLQSVVQLCALLGGRGLSLPAGSVVLAGAATQAVALEPGMQVRLRAGALGEVSVTVSAS